MNLLKKKSPITQSGFAHILLPAVIIVAIALLGGVVYTQVSKAATVANADYFQSGIAGKCMDDQYDGKTNYTKVQIYTCNQSAAQQWIVTSNGTIENANGACLDLDQAQDVNNTKLVMYSCNTNAAQQWKTAGTTLVNPESGKCIDDPYSNTTNGTQLILYTCKGTINQMWSAVTSESGTGGGGSSTTGSDASGSGGGSGTGTGSPSEIQTGLLASGLTNSSGSVMCLDDYQDSSTNGTAVNIYPCNKSDAGQQWSLYSDNTIRIHGKCLDVYQAATTNGTRMDLNTCDGNTNQQWSVGTNPDISLNNLTSKQSGNCLDVYNSETANSSETDLWSCDNTPAQVWGWVTGSSAIQAGGATALANCSKVIQGFGSSCVVQMGAYQANMGNGTYTGNATGVSANFTIYSPTCGVNCVHIANEWQIGTNGAKANLIEYGWTIAGDVPAGTHPELQIGLWANGQVLDADANFVQVSKTVEINEVLPVNGTVGNLKILYVASSSEWQLFYNGTEVGYYPESIWTSRGTSLTALNNINLFGEVYPSNPLLAAPVMQMGSGVLAGQSGAAQISDYTLYGSTVAPSFQPYTEGNQKLWTLSDVTATGFSYGGPGL
jgi:uncharacterized membrane protein YgcG